MMVIDREKVKQVFAEYVRHYDAEDPKVKLKILHTYRVSELCEAITRSILEWEIPEGKDEDALAGSSAILHEANRKVNVMDLAWLLGMLHDVGRFEQLRRYHTFFDAQSVSHAALGCEILFDEGMIGQFIPVQEGSAELELIRCAIACHSDYRIPEEYEERTKIFCRILRDADKIDIFRVNYETPLEDIYNVSTKELMQAEVSKEVMENFRCRRATPRELRKTPVDYLVSMISMSFELVYPKSREIALAQGYLDRLCSFSSENEQTNQQFEVLRKIMQDFR